MCQQDKIEQGHTLGLLESLSTLERPWEIISIDFITCLPKSDGCNNVMAVSDQFGKYGVFNLVLIKFTTKDATAILCQHVAKYY